MKPLGSEVAWDQREGKGQGETKNRVKQPPVIIFFAFADCFVHRLPSL